MSLFAIRAGRTQNYERLPLLQGGHTDPAETHRAEVVQTRLGTRLGEGHRVPRFPGHVPDLALFLGGGNPPGLQLKGKPDSTEHPSAPPGSRPREDTPTAALRELHLYRHSTHSLSLSLTHTHFTHSRAHILHTHTPLSHTHKLQQLVPFLPLRTTLTSRQCLSILPFSIVLDLARNSRPRCSLRERRPASLPAGSGHWPL